MNRGKLRSFALRSLIVSVVATALLGIVAVLANQLNNTTVKVLLTSLIVAVASLATLTCAALMERGHAKPLAYSGMILSILGATLAIIGMWANIDSNNYWRTTASTSVVGIFSAHICLLWLAHLAPRFNWVKWSALVVIYALAGVIVWAIVGEPSEDVIWRPLAVLGILGGAVTIVVPVLQKLSGPSETAADGEVAVHLTCPDCGNDVTADAGTAECAVCGCRISVSVLRRGRVESAPAPVASASVE
jgi:hypothetical protein